MHEQALDIKDTRGSDWCESTGVTPNYTSNFKLPRKPSLTISAGMTISVFWTEWHKSSKPCNECLLACIYPVVSLLLFL